MSACSAGMLSPLHILFVLSKTCLYVRICFVDVNFDCFCPALDYLTLFFSVPEFADTQWFVPNDAHQPALSQVPSQRDTEGQPKVMVVVRLLSCAGGVYSPLLVGENKRTQVG